jgi:hypothetical protein
MELRGSAVWEEAKNARSKKHDAVMGFYGLPPIGQKQIHPIHGAQIWKWRAQANALAPQADKVLEAVGGSNPHSN